MVKIRKRQCVGEAEVGAMNFKDGGRSHEPRSVGSLETLEKARKWIPPPSLQQHHSPAHLLILSPQNPFQTYDLCKIKFLKEDSNNLHFDFKHSNWLSSSFQLISYLQQKTLRANQQMLGRTNYPCPMSSNQQLPEPARPLRQVTDSKTMIR